MKRPSFSAPEGSELSAAFQRLRHVVIALALFSGIVNLRKRPVKAI